MDKPSGVTSRDVVNQVVRVLGRGVKVGHAGTLDPLASGVLVVCLGVATRLVEFIQGQPKTYKAVVRLGARSNTDDADGEITEVENAGAPTDEAIQKAVSSQVGTILQTPPHYAALKVGGRRAYELAREGKEIELAARPVSVYSIRVTGYEWPRLELEVDCGAGTYIRSIARDIGECLGCGGLIQVLVRTRIGSFTQADAVHPDDLTIDSLPALLRPAGEALAGLPSLTLTEDELVEIVHGRAINVVHHVSSGEVALVGPNGALVAVGEADEASRCVRPRRVLVNPK
jgi:tRNA pseudouridine55 synthase